MTVADAINCQELVELVTDYLEGALEPADLRRFEEHIAGCGKCTDYLEQLRQTIAVVGRITPDDLTPEAERELMDVFRDWAQAQEGS
jgi:predicted anti-sigma-YlaC factor YlaD